MKRLFILILIGLSSAVYAEKKTVLVTGGAGFIGHHFVEHMYDAYPDYTFIVLDSLNYSGRLENIPERIRKSSRFTFVKGSVCDPKVVDRLLKKSDFVVHFAAETDVTRSIVEDEVFFETNVMGTRNLLHHLVKHKNKVERFVHISSSEVYGTCEKEQIDEDHPINPRSPYAAAKAGADRAVYAYGCTYDVPVTILRFFNNFGPRQHVEKVVGKFISLAASNRPIEIHGSGSQTRDWIYVTDTARAVDAALHVKDFEKIRNEVINCGSGRATSVFEIAEAISNHFGKDKTLVLHTVDRPGQVQRHISSRNKAKKLLGWEPLISFEEGIAKTIKWYIAHPEFWKTHIEHPDVHKDNKVLIHEKINKRETRRHET